MTGSAEGRGRGFIRLDERFDGIQCVLGSHVSFALVAVGRSLN